MPWDMDAYGNTIWVDPQSPPPESDIDPALAEWLRKVEGQGVKAPAQPVYSANPPGATKPAKTTVPLEVTPNVTPGTNATTDTTPSYDFMAGLEDVPPFPSQSPPAGYHWEYDINTNVWIPVYGTQSQEQSKDGTFWSSDLIGSVGKTRWNPQTGEEEKATDVVVNGQHSFQWVPTGAVDITKTADWQMQERAKQLAAQESSASWERQMAWNNQQMASENTWRQQQLEADRQQRLATLRAQPKSWLEYASLAGETPTIQPWMLPLAPTEYGWNQSSVGQALPGWSTESESLRDLPQLTTPSAQYLARLSPTAREQYLGYQQATTGAPGEATEYNLWSSAPPSGRNVGLTYTR